MSLFTLGTAFLLISQTQSFTFLQSDILKAISCNDSTPDTETSQGEMFSYLTNACRYDKQKRPPTIRHRPVEVSARVYVYFLKATTSADLKFTAQILLQLKWEDLRLNFEDYNVSFNALLGEKYLMDSIWMPHVFMSNEKDSLVMGYLRKDDFVVVHSSGIVRFTTRLKTKVTCHMELGKFPFDVQKCSLVMDSWRYNSSELILEWEMPDPVQLQGGRVSLTEFSLVALTTETKNDLHHSSRDFNKYNYSSLILTFTLAREYGFYIMDYYIPSVLLVILSWVSFWLTPDALPARINLGSSTMLTFLLLGWGGGGMPKVSQFQSNNIWAIGCTLFIFLSLVEFAFVNTIDRSGSHKVPLKKPTSKYILKSTLSTSPKPPKIRIRRTSSCPSSPEMKRHFAQLVKPRLKILEELREQEAEFAFKLTSRLEDTASEPKDYPKDTPIPHSRENTLRQRKTSNKLAKEELEEVKVQLRKDSIKLSAFSFNEGKPHPPRKSSILSVAEVFTMTPQEIAKWIDEKSRIIFPTSFLFFCLFYWSFLWI